MATSTGGNAFMGTGVVGVSGGLAQFRDPAPGGELRRFSRWIITSPSAGPLALGTAPVVRVLRDDRVATLEMDYNADSPWGQFWSVGADGRSDAGFRVTWWPDGASPAAMVSMGACGGCHGACGRAMVPGEEVARTLVTPSRRVQLQPLANQATYHVRVERLNALGEVTSLPTEMTFAGGDETRVTALRAAMTYFDDFNLPEGPADEKLWNNAHSTSTDPRYNLFFINSQFHAHTLNGTQTSGPHVGDKSQTAQRFRKPILLETGVRRRIVFDMDSPMSPRSVWYLDLNPIARDLTGHADFFDEDGVKGLPAGVVRMRSQGQIFSVHLIGDDGASHKVASVDMEAAGVQVIPNVRRAFDVRLGTDGVEVFIDGKRVINQSFGGATVRPGAYEFLWSSIGYNTTKDNNPYFLLHWDNFGFDGPVVDPRVVHNYVTQIAGDDYQKSNRWSSTFPTFTVRIPDDSRPVAANATAEAWLVCTYQQGDFSPFSLRAGDHVLVNGVSYPLPARVNNSTPGDPALLDWGGSPDTARIKLGDIVQDGVSPLRVGDNTVQFFADNIGISNVHLEIFYPPGSAPAYTPPAAIHHFPMHAELPQLGPPARLAFIGNVEISAASAAIEAPEVIHAISGTTRIEVIAGGDPWAGWAPDLMVTPARSAELWSSGGTAGIRSVELFMRPKGGGVGTSKRIAVLTTQRDGPAPLVRHAFEVDTRTFANGEYELFVLATAANGAKSHPLYDNSAARWDSTEWSGAYYPVNIRITN
ncbi:hypothetical protein CMV30_07525 [Nibricoccus aquaticus]|uniref:Uncharacterized protein n=1 Tax=Nibricoccus aquaticus TaxID=2576891 RepID=A0A290Q550_9BACT|nr:hypothetical protein CMV30_07525 [Nibricoccus aquaticus]